MKTASIDFVACAKKPLEIFADLPLLFTTMYRTKMVMHQLLMQGANEHTFKRAGIILEYSEQLSRILNDACRQYIDVMAYAINIEDAEGNLNEAMLQEIYEQGRGDDFFLAMEWANSQESIEQLSGEIENIESLLMSENTINAFFRQPGLTEIQKKQAIDRLLKHIEQNISYNQNFEESFLLSQKKLTQEAAVAMHNAIVSPEALQGVANTQYISGVLEEYQNESLEFYGYLLQKKKEIYGE